MAARTQWWLACDSIFGGAPGHDPSTTKLWVYQTFSNMMDLQPYRWVNCMKYMLWSIHVCYVLCHLERGGMFWLFCLVTSCHGLWDGCAFMSLTCWFVMSWWFQLQISQLIGALYREFVVIDSRCKKSVYIYICYICINDLYIYTYIFLCMYKRSQLYLYMYKWSLYIYIFIFILIYTYIFFFSWCMITSAETAVRQTSFETYQWKKYMFWHGNGKFQSWCPRSFFCYISFFRIQFFFFISQNPLWPPLTNNTFCR